MACYPYQAQSKKDATQGIVTWWCGAVQMVQPEERMLSYW